MPERVLRARKGNDAPGRPGAAVRRRADMTDVDKRILIAEDDPVSVAVLRENLLKWGYDVVEVSNGEQAWAVLRREGRPACAVLDWMMPKLTAPDVCRRLRGIPGGASVHVLLLTAKDRLADVVEGLDAGADDYLCKPFHAAELRARIGVGMRLAELQARLAERAVFAERGYTQSEERFQSAFENAAIGMALVAPDGKWLPARPAAGRHAPRAAGHLHVGPYRRRHRPPRRSERQAGGHLEAVSGGGAVETGEGSARRVVCSLACGAAAPHAKIFV